MAVGFAGEGVVIAALGSARIVITPPDRVAAVLTKGQAANLATWLIMAGMLEREDLAPIFEAAGMPFPLEAPR